MIILGKEHKEKLSELTKEDLKSVFYLVNWVVKKWKIDGGALAVRFGNTNYNGGSVNHLHFHIISPEIDKNKKRAKVVNFPIG